MDNSPLTRDEQWIIRMKHMKNKVSIKHVDGKTEVTATILKTSNNEINLEYKFKGMTYGRTVTDDELEEIIKDQQ